MEDCKFCKNNPVKAEKLPVWTIGIPAPSTNKHYLSYKYITKRLISKDELRTTDKVTPAGRLLMSEADVSQIMAHQLAWDEFLASESEFGAFYETEASINSNKLHLAIENTELPRDWDIIMIGEFDYILNKRAARILRSSSIQVHCQLKLFLTIFDVLRVIKIPQAV